ncbi:MAG: nitroreductase family protein, partial [Bacteroidia bacterium]
MSILETLNWRYATKRMTGAKVPQAKVDTILEAARLSPSAFGMQPYKVIVIENEELRKKLQPVAYKQAQIAECSHLLVFAAFENITEQHILNHFNLLATTTGAPIEKFNDYIGMVKGSLLGLTEEVQFNWNARQTYIALGTALV